MLDGSHAMFTSGSKTVALTTSELQEEAEHQDLDLQHGVKVKCRVVFFVCRTLFNVATIR